MAARGSLWQSLVACGSQRQSVAASGSLGQPGAARGSQRQLYQAGACRKRHQTGPAAGIPCTDCTRVDACKRVDACRHVDRPASDTHWCTHNRTGPDPKSTWGCRERNASMAAIDGRDTLQLKAPGPIRRPADARAVNILATQASKGLAWAHKLCFTPKDLACKSNLLPG